MEEYITRAEFEEFKKEVGQQTEPIHLTIDRRVEESPLLQKVYDISGRLQTDVALLKGGMEGVEADIKAIRESQADFRDKLQTMATKDDISELKALIERLLP